jgi:Cys-rich repeat protein
VGEGCIDLQATDVLRGSVTITGYTPCTNDSQCPDGQSCNEALERCE